MKNRWSYSRGTHICVPQGGENFFIVEEGRVFIFVILQGRKCFSKITIAPPPPPYNSTGTSLMQNIRQHYYLAPHRGRARYCNAHVCLSVCVFVRVFAKFQSVISQPFLNRSRWNLVHTLVARRARSAISDCLVLLCVHVLIKPAGSTMFAYFYRAI